MGTTMNKAAYKRLVDENLEWLYEQPRTLEREHIIAICKWSIDALYPEEGFTVMREGRAIVGTIMDGVKKITDERE